MLTLESVETDPETGGLRRMSLEYVSELKDGDLVYLAPILAAIAFSVPAVRTAAVGIR